MMPHITQLCCVYARTHTHTLKQETQTLRVTHTKTVAPLPAKTSIEKDLYLAVVAPPLQHNTNHPAGQKAPQATPMLPQHMPQGADV